METTSASVSDGDFLSAFESCELPAGAFHHRDHLRLAWIYLQRLDPIEAGVRISLSIRRYAEHHGAAGKYHETITQAWLQLVASATTSLPGDARFEQILDLFPHLLNKNLLLDFYSAETLQSEAARNVFLQPDRKPLTAAARPLY